MLLMHTGSNKWKHPATCRRKANMRLLSLLVITGVRGMLESTSIASAANRHTYTHALQRYDSLQTKGCNTNQHGYDPHSYRPSFSTHLIPKQSTCVHQQLWHKPVCLLNIREDTTALNASSESHFEKLTNWTRYNLYVLTQAHKCIQ